ncbi:MAG TPA: hypothetical protein VK823_12495 [Streptosporangiaceae bacterium]|jgi:hypothetical protein|nr:hypothetical protein [Streptosporangiaceae bacterium]
MTTPRPSAAFLKAMQHGVLSREQALAIGLSESGLRHRIRPGGPWRKLLPGVYLTSNGTATVQQMDTAAWLYACPDAFITGPAALRFHEIRGPKATCIDVLAPTNRKVVSRGFVVIQRTRRLPQTWMQDGDVVYAPPHRAVADTVRGLTRLADARTVVASAVQLRRCTIDDLARELRDRCHGRDAMLRLVLAEVADGIRSAPEGEARELITKAGLPKPVYNPTLLWRGKFLAKPDAWWPEAGVALEVDSMAFHLLPSDWRQTMHRHSRMTAAGIRVLHISPYQLRTQPEVVVQLIRDALTTGRPAAGIVTRA